MNFANHRLLKMLRPPGKTASDFQACRDVQGWQHNLSLTLMVTRWIISGYVVDIGWRIGELFLGVT